MNHIYRLVWSHVNQAWIAVAENARGHGKSISARKLIAAAATLAGGSLLASSAYAADAANATVVGGTGSVAQSGTTTTINQTSQRLAIDWSSLNTAANEALVFRQPNASAIALNRITGASPSTLLGSLTANGQVYILNPNGVLFGAGAQVNVGGLVASTLNMNAADFMNGSNTFTKDANANASSSVVNQGTLTAANGGYIALISGTVRNEGAINAPLGTALLVAGNKVTLNINNGSLLGYTIDQGDLNALVENKQLIRADGGQVIMAAKALDKLSTAVINNTGTIEARTIQNQNGKILLIGDMETGTVNVAGTLDASAPTGGDGGFIETSAAHVKVADGTVVTTASVQGLTGSWLIDPTDFTIASGSGAQTSSGIGASTLANSLATTSVILRTDNSSGTDSGDINVNAAVSWSANTTLTLNAYNDININAAITATGASAGLVLNYGNYATAGVVTAGTDYNVNAPVTLSGSSATLSINGAAYTLIHSMAALQVINRADLNGHYALAGDLNASGTTYTDALIGSSNANFGGTFAGLGHTLSNLSISSGGDAGLFGVTGSTSVVRDIVLVNESVSSLGGITAGGLAGRNSGTISNSHATGSVSGAYDEAGGLVGINTGTIRNSYASSDVSGFQFAGGGLVGSNEGGGTVSNSYATGSVSGSTYAMAGGLAGFCFGTISNSYATGNVNNSTYGVAGGLVGVNNGIVSNSYATGSVSGAGSYSGGLVGLNGGTTSNSYATGSVSGTGYVGGLIGNNTSFGTITASFWNMTSSGTSVGVGGGSSSGVVGIDSVAASQIATFVNAGWSIGATGGTSTIWRIYEGETGPLLRSFLTAITVTADATSKTYDGTAGMASTYGTNVDGAVLSGSLSYLTSKNAGTYTTAGGTLIQSGLYSTQQGYDISYADASLTINKADLTVTASAVTKTYDGTTSAAGSNSVGALAGAAAGDVVSSTGSEAFADKNAGSNKTVIASGVTVQDSSNTDVTANYNIIYVANTASTINKADLTVTASAVTKTYDGTTSTTGTGTVGALAGAAAGDAVNSAGSEVFTDRNAGTGKTVVASGVTIKDASNADVSNNYNITYVDNTASTISKANVSVSTTDVIKTYDGTTSATGTAVATSGTIFSGDTLSGGSFVYADKNAGSGNKVVTTSGATISDGNGGNNYNVTYVDNTTSTINKADLTVTASTVTKTYDGTTSAAGSNSIGALAGAAAGDAISSAGSEAFADKNAGSNKTVIASGVTVQDSSNTDVTGNYNIIYVANTASTIKKADLTVTASAVTKTYDGTASTTGTGIVGTLAGAAAGDAVNSAGSEVFTDKNAGTGKTVVASGVTIKDASNADVSSNYNITYVDNTAGTINKANVSVSTTDVTKTYDGTTSATGTAVATSGTIFSGDTLSGGSFVYTDKNAGSGNKVVTTSGATISDGNGGNNYNITYVDNTTSTINKADLTVTASAVTKTYDGTTGAAGSNSIGALAGAAAGDAISSTGSEAFVDKNAGSNKTVIASGVTVQDSSNADVTGNYNIIYVANTASTINKADLTVTASAVTKTYDGTTSTTSTGTVGALAGAAAGDAVNSAGSEVFTDRNAGTGKTVVASGVTIKDASNADVSSNYNITYVDNTAGTINKANVSVSTTDVTKTYDGTTSATGSAVATVGTIFSGDTLSGGSFVYTDKNAGSGNKVVTTSGATISDGNGGNNYNITYVDNTTSTINKADLTVTASAVTKTYDGTTSTTGTGTVGALAGAAAGDVVNSTGSEAFADKNAGSNKTIIASGVTIKDASDADVSGNYNITYVDNTAGTVNKANVTVSTADVTKTYDGTTSAAGAAVATVGTIFGGDTLSGGSFAYTDKNAGSGDKIVTTSGVTISDGNGGNNYNVTYVDNTTSTINKANVSVSTTDVIKTYDGTTSATGTAVATVGTIFSGDTLSGGSFVYTDKNAGSGNKVVTVSGANISDGNGGSNYNISYVDNTTSTINKANLTVTANAVTKTYDGTTSATGAGTVGTLAGAVAGDVVNSAGSEVFTDKNAGSGKTVVASGVTIKDVSSVDVSSNYNIIYVANTTGIINKADLAVTVNAADKVYDGSTSASLIYTDNRIVGDVLNFTSTSSFADKNVGTAKALTISGVSIGGTDAGNYNLIVIPGTATASITPASLTVTANSSSKYYDGQAYSGNGGVTVSGLVSGDTLADLAGTLSYGGSARGATGIGSYDIAPGGLSSGNYVIRFIDGVLTIKALSQTSAALGGSAMESNYDGAQQTLAITPRQFDGQYARLDKNKGPLADVKPVSDVTPVNGIVQLTPRLSWVQ